MEIVVNEDYTIRELNIDSDFHYIRSIQMDGNRENLEKLMKRLTETFKMKFYQYNFTDYNSKDYIAYYWCNVGCLTDREDYNCITLNYNSNKSIKDIYRSMETILKVLKDLQKYEFNTTNIRVWVKLNDIRNVIKEKEVKK
jgi:hypothetical protein